METIMQWVTAIGLAPFVDDIGVFFRSANASRVLIWLLVAGVTAGFMEPWAAFVHRAAWHGPLLVFHRSHHRLKRTRFEANDIFAVMHAPVAIAFIVLAVVLGPRVDADVLFGFGAGMTLYGLSYFVFHDGLVHGRLPVAFLGRIRMFSDWRDAHLEHHRTGTFPYGFFRGPTELKQHPPPPRTSS